MRPRLRANMMPSFAASTSATRGEGAEISREHPARIDPEESRTTTATAPPFLDWDQEASTLTFKNPSGGGAKELEPNNNGSSGEDSPPFVSQLINLQHSMYVIYWLVR